MKKSKLWLSSGTDRETAEYIVRSFEEIVFLLYILIRRCSADLLPK